MGMPAVTPNNFDRLMRSIDPQKDKNPLLILNSKGGVKATNPASFAWEKVCGFFGGKDMCHNKLVGLSILNYLDYAVSHPEGLDMQKIEVLKELATTLLRTKKAVGKKDLETIIQKITECFKKTTTTKQEKIKLHDEIEAFNKLICTTKKGMEKYANKIPHSLVESAIQPEEELPSLSESSETSEEEPLRKPLPKEQPAPLSSRASSLGERMVVMQPIQPQEQKKEIIKEKEEKEEGQQEQELLDQKQQEFVQQEEPAQATKDLSPEELDEWLLAHDKFVEPEETETKPVQVPPLPAALPQAKVETPRTLERQEKETDKETGTGEEQKGEAGLGQQGQDLSQQKEAGQEFSQQKEQKQLKTAITEKAVETAEPAKKTAITEKAVETAEPAKIEAEVKEVEKAAAVSSTPAEQPVQENRGWLGTMTKIGLLGAGTFLAGAALYMLLPRYFSFTTPPENSDIPASDEFKITPFRSDEFNYFEDSVSSTCRLYDQFALDLSKESLTGPSATSTLSSQQEQINALLETREEMKTFYGQSSLTQRFLEDLREFDKNKIKQPKIPKEIQHEEAKPSFAEQANATETNVTETVEAAQPIPSEQIDSTATRETQPPPAPQAKTVEEAIKPPEAEPSESEAEPVQTPVSTDEGAAPSTVETQQVPIQEPASTPPAPIPEQKSYIDDIVTIGGLVLGIIGIGVIGVATKVKEHNPFLADPFENLMKAGVKELNLMVGKYAEVEDTQREGRGDSAFRFNVPQESRPRYLRANAPDSFALYDKDGIRIVYQSYYNDTTTKAEKKTQAFKKTAATTPDVFEINPDPSILLVAKFRNKESKEEKIEFLVPKHLFEEARAKDGSLSLNYGKQMQINISNLSSAERSDLSHITKVKHPRYSTAGVMGFSPVIAEYMSKEDKEQFFKDENTYQGIKDKLLFLQDPRAYYSSIGGAQQTSTASATSTAGKTVAATPTITTTAATTTSTSTATTSTQPTIPPITPALTTPSSQTKTEEPKIEDKKEVEPAATGTGTISAIFGALGGLFTTSPNPFLANPFERFAKDGIMQIDLSIEKCAQVENTQMQLRDGTHSYPKFNVQCMLPRYLRDNAPDSIVLHHKDGNRVAYQSYYGEKDIVRKSLYQKAINLYRSEPDFQKRLTEINTDPSMLLVAKFKGKGGKEEKIEFLIPMHVFDKAATSGGSLSLVYGEKLNINISNISADKKTELSNITNINHPDSVSLDFKNDIPFEFKYYIPIKDQKLFIEDQKAYEQKFYKKDKETKTPAKDIQQAPAATPSVTSVTEDQKQLKEQKETKIGGKDTQQAEAITTSATSTKYSAEVKLGDNWAKGLQFLSLEKQKEMEKQLENSELKYRYIHEQKRICNIPFSEEDFPVELSLQITKTSVPTEKESVRLIFPSSFLLKLKSEKSTRVLLYKKETLSFNEKDLDQIFTQIQAKQDELIIESKKAKTTTSIPPITPTLTTPSGQTKTKEPKIEPKKEVKPAAKGTGIINAIFGLFTTSSNPFLTDPFERLANAGATQIELSIEKCAEVKNAKMTIRDSDYGYPRANVQCMLPRYLRDNAPDSAALCYKGGKRVVYQSYYGETDQKWIDTYKKALASYLSDFTLKKRITEINTDPSMLLVAKFSGKEGKEEIIEFLIPKHVYDEAAASGGSLSLVYRDKLNINISNISTDKKTELSHITKINHPDFASSDFTVDIPDEFKRYIPSKDQEQFIEDQKAYVQEFRKERDAQLQGKGTPQASTIPPSATSVTVDQKQLKEGEKEPKTTVKDTEQAPTTTPQATPLSQILMETNKEMDQLLAPVYEARDKIKDLELQETQVSTDTETIASTAEIGTPVLSTKKDEPGTIGLQLADTWGKDEDAIVLPIRKSEATRKWEKEIQDNKLTYRVKDATRSSQINFHSQDLPVPLSLNLPDGNVNITLPASFLFNLSNKERPIQLLHKGTPILLNSADFEVVLSALRARENELYGHLPKSAKLPSTSSGKEVETKKRQFVAVGSDGNIGEKAIVEMRVNDPRPFGTYTTTTTTTSTTTTTTTTTTAAAIISPITSTLKTEPPFVPTKTFEDVASMIKGEMLSGGKISPDAVKQIIEDCTGLSNEDLVSLLSLPFMENREFPSFGTTFVGTQSLLFREELNDLFNLLIKRNLDSTQIKTIFSQNARITIPYQSETLTPLLSIRDKFIRSLPLLEKLDVDTIAELLSMTDSKGKMALSSASMYNILFNPGVQGLVEKIYQLRESVSPHFLEEQGKAYFIPNLQQPKEKYLLPTLSTETPAPAVAATSVQLATAAPTASTEAEQPKPIQVLTFAEVVEMIAQGKTKNVIVEACGKLSKEDFIALLKAQVPRNNAALKKDFITILTEHKDWGTPSSPRRTSTFIPDLMPVIEKHYLNKSELFEILSVCDTQGKSPLHYKEVFIEFLPFLSQLGVEQLAQLLLIVDKEGKRPLDRIEMHKILYHPNAKALARILNNYYEIQAAYDSRIQKSKHYLQKREDAQLFLTPDPQTPDLKYPVPTVYQVMQKHSMIGPLNAWGLNSIISTEEVLHHPAAIENIKEHTKTLKGLLGILTKKDDKRNTLLHVRMSEEAFSLLDPFLDSIFDAKKTQEERLDMRNNLVAILNCKNNQGLTPIEAAVRVPYAPYNKIGQLVERLMKDKAILPDDFYKYICCKEDWMAIMKAIDQEMYKDPCAVGENDPNYVFAKLPHTIQLAFLYNKEDFDKMIPELSELGYETLARLLCDGPHAPMKDPEIAKASPPLFENVKDYKDPANQQKPHYLNSDDKGDLYFYPQKIENPGIRVLIQRSSWKDRGKAYPGSTVR